MAKNKNQTKETKMFRILLLGNKKPVETASKMCRNASAGVNGSLADIKTFSTSNSSAYESKPEKR